MSSIIFGEKINITTFESETHGATSGYVVGYDLDGILKQKDIITGSVSLIGAAAAGGSLSSALLIGNQTGITPIISSTSSYILSGSGVNKIDLNAGTITSGTSSSYSYLIISGSSVALGNGGLGSRRFLIGNTSITTEYNTSNSQVIGSSSYVLRLSGQNVLTFNSGTVSSGSSTISSIISSKDSSISANAINSIIIGGEAIVATQSDHTYVSNLYVQSGKVIRGTGIGQVKFNATQSIINFGGNNVTISSGSVNLGGTVSVNNLYNLPNYDGNTGQIIKTDGLGNLSWTDNASNLTYTTLPTTSISSIFTIYNNNGSTTFSTYSISGLTVSGTSNLSSITVPTGSKVSYSGTASIASGTPPTSILGDYIFTPNLPLTYPAYGLTSSSNISVNKSFSVILLKPKTGLTVINGQVTSPLGNDILSLTASVTFSDLFYFGSLLVGGLNLPITQLQVDAINATQIQNLGNYSFGTKSQTFNSTDSSGYRLAFAYPSSYGDINSLTYASSILNSISAFKRASNDVVITTLSGLTASYRLYVANADNSWTTSVTTT
jgi:hypothetical protein